MATWKVPTIAVLIMFQSLHAAGAAIIGFGGPSVDQFNGSPDYFFTVPWQGPGGYEVVEFDYVDGGLGTATLTPIAWTPDLINLVISPVAANTFFDAGASATAPSFFSETPPSTSPLFVSTAFTGSGRNPSYNAAPFYLGVSAFGNAFGWIELQPSRPTAGSLTTLTEVASFLDYDIEGVTIGTDQEVSNTPLPSTSILFLSGLAILAAMIKRRSVIRPKNLSTT